MGRRGRGFNDPFPRLPPGCTPSDIDRHFGEPGRKPDPEPPEERDCMVCSPPPDARKFMERHDDLSRLPYCGNHDADDLRAKMEHDAERRDEQEQTRLQEAYEANHDGSD